jgi:hypothetical protein
VNVEARCANRNLHEGANFIHHFGRPASFPYKPVAVKRLFPVSAAFFEDVFHRVLAHLGESRKLEIDNKHYYFLAGSNVVVPVNLMPPAFQINGMEPNHHPCQRCPRVRENAVNPLRVFPCGHSFHIACHPAETCGTCEDIHISVTRANLNAYDESLRKEDEHAAREEGSDSDSDHDDSAPDVDDDMRAEDLDQAVNMHMRDWDDVNNIIQRVSSWKMVDAKKYRAKALLNAQKPVPVNLLPKKKQRRPKAWKCPEDDCTRTYVGNGICKLHCFPLIRIQE